MLDYWPQPGQSLLAIKDPGYTVHIKWSKNYFDDYRKLAHYYVQCGTAVFTEVINSDHDNVKADTWFLAGIYLLRHALELGLKSLVCRTSSNTPNIQSAFLSCQSNAKTAVPYWMPKRKPAAAIEYRNDAP